MYLINNKRAVFYLPRTTKKQHLKMIDGCKGVMFLFYNHNNQYCYDTAIGKELTKSNTGKIKNFKLFDGDYNTRVIIRLTYNETKDNGLIGKKESLTTI